MGQLTVKVPIELDKPRTLFFPLAALLAFKKETGIDLLQESIKDEDWTLETITALLWAGLIHEDKELTMDDVANSVCDLVYIRACIERAFMEQMPVPEADAEGGEVKNSERSAG